MSGTNKRNYPLKSQVCNKDSCNSDKCSGNQHKYQKLLPVVKYSKKKLEQVIVFLFDGATLVEHYLMMQKNKYNYDAFLILLTTNRWMIMINKKVINENPRFLRIGIDTGEYGHLVGLYRKENIFYFFDSSFCTQFFNFIHFFFTRWDMFRKRPLGIVPVPITPLTRETHSVIDVSKRLQKPNDRRCYKHACDWLLNRAKSNNACKKKKKVSISNSSHQQKSQKK